MKRARSLLLSLRGDMQSIGHWALCWILIPNAGFWALWIAGGPPSILQILLFGNVGIAVHRAPFPIKITAFLTVMILSVLLFISGMFNLNILSLIVSVKFLEEMHISASVEYISGGLLLVGAVFAELHALRRLTPFARPMPHIVIAACLVWLFVLGDVAMSRGNRGSYDRSVEQGAAFTSASHASGLETIATGKRHVLFIMVESMGQPADPALRRRLIDVWARAEVRQKYQVTSGETLFYGSTTTAEMRELCGRWGEYAEVMDRNDPRCLPARLRSRGYHTQAWHSFDGNFFERFQWYPHIGFTELRFGPRIVRDGARNCPGVFPGACDSDVPEQISGVMKQAKGPQFIYWLTVNSHIPVIESERLRTNGCDDFDKKLNMEYPMVCRLFALFDDVGKSLAHEITMSDFPDTDILIVGDHIPPFFHRDSRDLFAPDRVPWILLRKKPVPDSPPAS